MIPNSSNFQNANYKQNIKIQLTNDNRCIIQSTLETPNKSPENIINKSEPSLNAINYTDNDNDNDFMSLSKSLNSISNVIKPNIDNNQNEKKKVNNKQNNIDNDGNSNLLISFSNISELAKINNNDNSIFGAGCESIKKNTPKKKIFEDDASSSILNPQFLNYFDNSNFKYNKENIDINNKNMSIYMGIGNKSEYSNDRMNLVSSSKKSNNTNTNINMFNNLYTDNSNVSRQLLDSFNKNNISEISDIVNWNINNKSILSNKENNKDKDKDILTTNINNILDNINIKDNSNIYKNQEKSKKEEIKDDKGNKDNESNKVNKDINIKKQE